MGSHLTEGGGGGGETGYVSLDFRAVVWRIEEETMPLSEFYYCICDFPRRCRISTHLYVVSHHFICLVSLFAKQPFSNCDKAFCIFNYISCRILLEFPTVE